MFQALCRRLLDAAQLKAVKACDTLLSSAESINGPNLMQDRGDEDISKQPLVIDGMGVGVRGVGKPEGLGNRGPFDVGLVKGGVKMRQQLVTHA